MISSFSSNNYPIQGKSRLVQALPGRGVAGTLMDAVSRRFSDQASAPNSYRGWSLISISSFEIQCSAFKNRSIEKGQMWNLVKKIKWEKNLDLWSPHPQLVQMKACTRDRAHPSPPSPIIMVRLFDIFQIAMPISNTFRVLCISASYLRRRRREGWAAKHRRSG